MATLISGMRSDRKRFSPTLHLVGSTNSSSTIDFESMEDVPSLISLVESNLATITHNMPSRRKPSRSRSFHISPHTIAPTDLTDDPLRRKHALKTIHTIGDLGEPRYQSLGQSHDFIGGLSGEQSARADIQRSLPSVYPPTVKYSRSSSAHILGRRASQADAMKRHHSTQLPSVDESSVTSQSLGLPRPADPSTHSLQTLKANDNSVVLSPTSSTPRLSSHTTSVDGDDSRSFAGTSDPQVRRKSLEPVPATSKMGTKRLKRSHSMWETSIHSSDIMREDPPGFRLETQMTERQRAMTVKRARKIAQVFGCEAPIELIQGPEDGAIKGKHRNSFASVLSISSFDLMSNPSPSRRRSNSASSSSSDAQRPADIGEPFHPPDESPPQSCLDQYSPDSDVPQSSALAASFTFNERRRRAAKLSRFFGVNYQDISHSIVTQQTSPPPIKPHEGFPAVEVDVKVAGRRFWGFTDGRDHLKNAEVVDVIDKLRGLKAA